MSGCRQRQNGTQCDFCVHIFADLQNRFLLQRLLNIISISFLARVHKHIGLVEIVYELTDLSLLVMLNHRFELTLYRQSYFVLIDYLDI